MGLEKVTSLTFYESLLFSMFIISEICTFTNTDNFMKQKPEVSRSKPLQESETLLY